MSVVWRLDICASGDWNDHLLVKARSAKRWPNEGNLHSPQVDNQSAVSFKTAAGLR